MKKKLLALLLALTMLTLPILASAEEAAATTVDDQSFNKYYAYAMRSGMTLQTEMTFASRTAELVSGFFGLSESAPQIQILQGLEDLVNALTITEQTAMNGGSMTVNISGTDVFTVAVEAVDGVLYISSDLSDSVLAIDAAAIPEFLNAVTGSALENSAYITDEFADDLQGQAAASAQDGILTLNQALLADDDADDQTIPHDEALALLATQFPNMVAWIQQRIAACTSEVTEQPEGCDPAAICFTYVTDNAAIQDMKTAFLTDLASNKDRLEAVATLISAFTGESADDIVAGMQIALEVANTAAAERAEFEPDLQNAPANDGEQPSEPMNGPGVPEVSQLNEHDADLSEDFTVYVDDQGEVVKASWVCYYKNSDMPAIGLTDESSDLTLKLDYARNTNGDTVNHTLDITAMLYGAEIGSVKVAMAETNTAARAEFDCQADINLMGTTVLAADLNGYTDADNLAGLSLIWTDSEGQSRGVILSSEWTIDAAPSEDVAAVIAWTGSMSGLNIEEPVEAIHATYTITYDPFTVEGKENAVVLSALSEKDLDDLATEYAVGAMQCAAKTVSVLPESSAELLVDLLKMVKAY